MGWRESERRLDETVLGGHSSSMRPGAPSRTPSGRGCLRWLAIGAIAMVGLVVVLSVIGYAVGVRTDTSSPVTARDSRAPRAEQDANGIGQTARTGDLEVTLIEVR